MAQVLGYVADFEDSHYTNGVVLLARGDFAPDRKRGRLEQIRFETASFASAIRRAILRSSTTNGDVMGRPPVPSSIDSIDVAIDANAGRFTPTRL